MGKSEKRNFEEIGTSQTDDNPVYVYSARERRTLKKCVRKRPKFSHHRSVNHDFDVDTKMVAIKASPFVVSLVSFSGELLVSQSCGTIIEANDNNNTVLTSLNLIRQPTDANMVENTLAKNLKIVVRCSDENSYVGDIETYDFHYNLLVIKFKSKTSLKPANLRMINDDFGSDRSLQLLRPHSIKIKPGDRVLVVGRYFYKPFDFMAAPGIFGMYQNLAKYDCRELFSSTCNITRCGDGGPLVNLSGEVIGIAFYELGAASPFLPINIAQQMVGSQQTIQPVDLRELRHPSYGFEASNLYSSSLPILDVVMARFSNISNGVLVKKVQPGSYAESAGLSAHDVITKCDGKAVKSFLELWDLMWDKVGDTVELEVVKVDNFSVEKINMEVGEAIPHELNKKEYDELRGL